MIFEQICCDMFSEPVDHILSRNGFCSLRNAAVFLRNTEILVNGKRVLFRNDKADIEKDEISVGGNIIPNQKHIYLILNKPLGFVCSNASDSHKTVYDLIPERFKKIDEEYAENYVKGCVLHSVGRLDSDSCGLLVLTTNGKFSNFLTSPENKIEKTYEIRLAENISEENRRIYRNAFENGIELFPQKHGKAFRTKPASLIFKSGNECEVRISEGKFRQIRRMFEALGNEVVFLKRTSIGSLKMPDDLKEGEVQEIARKMISNDKAKLIEGL